MTTYLCDTNVWIALALSEHQHHTVAEDWLDAVQDASSVLFCRSTQQSFLRLVTAAATFAEYGIRPLSSTAAWSVYDRLIEDDRIAFRAGEPAGLERRWRQFSQRATASPKLWMDAYLAAFAGAEGARMVTTDRAFRQFVGLDLLLLGAGDPA